MQINRIALVGLGSIGRRHLRLLCELRPDIDVILVRSGKGQSWPEEKLAERVIYNFEELMDFNIQAAIISSPSTEHIWQAFQLAQERVHLLVEKPLSNSFNGVKELIKEVLSKGIVGLVGYIFHYDPAAQRYKEILGNEKIGHILHATVDCGSYLPDWRPGQDYRQSVSAKKELGGGVLLELSHELDYIRWFFGEMSSVYASLKYSGTLELDVEDSADMIFDSEKGFPVCVHLDFNRRITKRKCCTRCTEGNLVWDAVSQKITWHPANGNEEIEYFDHDFNSIYKAQLNHFFECVEHGKEPSLSLDDGIEALRLVEAARESSLTGRSVRLI